MHAVILLSEIAGYKQPVIFFGSKNMFGDRIYFSVILIFDICKT